MAVSKNIILGSGKLYLAKYTGETFDASTVAVESNQIGLVKGGASIEYKPTTTEIYDDLKVVHKRFITGEEVIFKTGLITFDLNALATIAGDASYTTATGTNTLKLGGKEGREIQKLALVFVHTKSDTKSITVSMVATNEAGLNLAFKPDEATQIDAEFKAVSMDDNGVLVQIEEEVSST